MTDLTEFYFWISFVWWAFLTACLVYMWEYCIDGYNRIFSFYKILLMERALRVNAPEVLRRINNEVDEKMKDISGANQVGLKKIRHSMYVPKLEQFATTYLFWEKPLGLCPVCFTPYIAFVVFFCCGFQSYFVNGGWFYTLPFWFMMLSSFLYRKISH